MIFRLLRRHRQGQDTIRSLYGAIVAQARQPDFYRACGVPDTVDGRFDMIVLHLALRPIFSPGRSIFPLRPLD